MSQFGVVVRVCQQPDADAVLWHQHALQKVGADLHKAGYVEAICRYKQFFNVGFCDRNKSSVTELNDEVHRVRRHLGHVKDPTVWT